MVSRSRMSELTGSICPELTLVLRVCPWFQYGIPSPEPVSPGAGWSVFRERQPTRRSVHGVVLRHSCCSWCATSRNAEAHSGNSAAPPYSSFVPHHTTACASPADDAEELCRGALQRSSPISSAAEAGRLLGRLPDLRLSDGTVFTSHHASCITLLLQYYMEPPGSHPTSSSVYW